MAKASHIFGNVYCFPAGSDSIEFDRPVSKIKNISENDVMVMFDGGFGFTLSNNETAEFPNLAGYPKVLNVSDDVQVFIQVQAYGDYCNDNYFAERGEL